MAWKDKEFTDNWEAQGMNTYVQCCECTDCTCDPCTCSNIRDKVGSTYESVKDNDVCGCG